MSLNDKNLFIAMPVYRTMDTNTAKCLLRLQGDSFQRREFNMALDFHVGEAPIGRARNDLTHTFLENKEFTHLMFIDSDIQFSYDQIKRLAEHDEDIVAGMYMIKCEGTPRPCINRLDTIEQPNERGLMKVKYAGTGFLRISRKAFEVMIQERGSELRYKCDGDNKSIKHDFWKMGVWRDENGDGRWLSEDWFFCQMARELGFDVWLDLNILVNHVGPANFPLQTQLPQIYTPDQLQRMGLSAPVKTDSDGAGTAKDALPSVAPATTLT